MNARKIIFWMHLAAGLTAGVVIAIMSFTGVALAFEKEIIAWAESGARAAGPPPAGGARLPFEVLARHAREVHPDATPASITLYADPQAAALISFGRTNSLLLDPYTGDVRSTGAPGVRKFMNVMFEWHRWLGRDASGRPTGKAITGACNAAFLVLAISGLYLWWPRQWTRSVLRSVTLFNFKLRGKARDWNWHNVIGLWCAPILIVLTVTAMPISYQWAGNLIYKLTGTEASAPGGGPAGSAAATPPIEAPPDSRPLGLDALVAAVQKEVPNWDQIIWRPAGSGSRGGSPSARDSGSSRPAETPAQAASGRAESKSESPGSPEARSREREGDGRIQPLTLTVKERGGRPRFASVQLRLNPFTGEVLRRESFQDYNLGRKVRSWMRFLHTGEALGPAGQTAAGLASLGGLFLVWTGFALAWRRFFKSRVTAAGSGVIDMEVNAGPAVSELPRIPEDRIAG